MKFSSLLILLLFVTGICRATDYYVSSTGSNSNNGTSQTTPWQTLSKVESVCNAGTILPGDRILFKRGDSFTGSIIIGSIWGKRAKSGTAANPITFSAYGTGAKPIFLYPTGGTTNVTGRITMTIVGVDYYIFDNLNFTDLDKTNNKITPANCGMALYLGAESEASTNHCTVQNVDVSFCGMGIVLIGDFNKVTGCNLTDFKNLKSTNGGDDDYGANALTIISGNDNEIVNNYIAGAWSASLDYGWNGGACEIFNSCHRNKLMYNTFYDCGGVSEFGAYENNASANDNLIAYNKIINCGGLSWCNISGNFAIQVSNLQYFNNVIIENNASRFSGPNTGMGLTAQYQALIGPETLLFAYNGSPSSAAVFNLKNNVFQLSTGLDVVRSNDSKTIHANNIYKLSGGSTLNVSLASTELNTTGAIFSNTTAADPISWNYTPASGSPVIDFGQNVGIAKDFVGNIVPQLPNAGILETVTGSSALSATSTSGVISCFGGTTTVTVTASGGTSPYTGTGTFTVSSGTYNYNITDAAGTMVVTSVVVTEPTKLSASIVAGTAASGSGTTTATILASGGTIAYTYSLDGGTFQSSNIFQNVTVGSHSVTVKDSRGCTVIKEFTVSSAAGSALVASATAGTISCNKGTTTVTVTATGGTSPYTGTGTFTVIAGTYTYTITDAAGTTKTATVTVTEPTAITATVTSGIASSSSGTTTATVTANGGTPSYTYKLDSGSFQSGTTFQGVTVGSHTITIRDGKSCSISKAFNVSFSGGSALVITAVTGTVACNGGTTTVTISAAGGRAPYTGIGTFTVAAGTYTYTVTDADGTTGTYNVTVTQPTAIIVNTTATAITTTGGVAVVTVNASGGTAPYTYKIGSGSFQSSNAFTGITVGTYSITVKDSRGCTASKSQTIISSQGQPLQIKLVSITNPSCKWVWDATITVGATGGTAPYYYRINNYGYGTRSTFINLGPGIYTLTVKDATGALSSMNVTIQRSTKSCSGKTTGKGIEEEVTTEVNSMGSDIDIQAYPNPTSTEFSLVINNENINESAEVVVMNMNGQKVFQTKTRTNQKINFGNNFVSGTYIVKVMQGKNTATRKLVKTK